MPNDGPSTVRRTLQFKFTLPAMDPSQLVPMMRAAWPFVEAMGGRRMRLLQNVDDPARFVQEIEYETHEAIELNRQRLASDWRGPGRSPGRGGMSCAPGGERSSPTGARRPAA